MDSPKKSLHVTDHLANERTFLAWIRTAIAVMTLGVAINRFALFLMEIHQVRAGGARPRQPARREARRLPCDPGHRRDWWAPDPGDLHVGRTIEDESYRPSSRVMVGTAIVIVVVGGSALIWLF